MTNRFYNEFGHILPRDIFPDVHGTNKLLEKAERNWREREEEYQTRIDDLRRQLKELETRHQQETKELERRNSAMEKKLNSLSFFECPGCQQFYPRNEIDRHVNQCLELVK